MSDLLYQRSRDRQPHTLAAKTKRLAVVSILFFGLFVTSKSALGEHSSESSRKPVSVVGVWRYAGGDEKPIEIHFLPDHKVMFKGGYEFYNPAEWYFNPATAELKLILPKMKQDDFKLFNQWINTGLKINPKEKSIVYTLREARICFMGYFFDKESNAKLCQSVRGFSQTGLKRQRCSY